MIIAIHPFADGNGRTGRALVNLVLASGGHDTIDFPANNALYHRSVLWKRVKRHLIDFIHELGWNLRKGSVPPRGYFEKVRTRLEASIAGA